MLLLSKILNAELLFVFYTVVLLVSKYLSTTEEIIDFSYLPLISTDLFWTFSIFFQR